MEPIAIGKLRLVVLTIRLNEGLDVPPWVSDGLFHAIDQGEVASVRGGNCFGSKG